MKICATTTISDQPYRVGKHKRSLAMILPTEIVKALDIDPQTVLLLLRVKDINNIYIKIIRQGI